MGKVKVSERVAQQMGAAGYIVFDSIENDRLVSYVFENQFIAWKASFNSY